MAMAVVLKILSLEFLIRRGIANQLPSENSITHLNRCEESAD